MVLYIYVEKEELREKYQVAIENHHLKMKSEYPDAGFDLFVPEDKILESKLVCIDYGIKCEAYLETDDLNGERKPTGYYLYPRSSIYKTPLRMCNSVGIIDSGYRGNIKSNFDVLCNDKLEKFDRVNQICAPGLLPIHVYIVEKEEELTNTSRGSGGFGSTGK